MKKLLVLGFLIWCLLAVVVNVSQVLSHPPERNFYYQHNTVNETLLEQKSSTVFNPRSPSPQSPSAPTPKPKLSSSSSSSFIKKLQEFNSKEFLPSSDDSDTLQEKDQELETSETEQIAKDFQSSANKQQLQQFLFTSNRKNPYRLFLTNLSRSIDHQSSASSTSTTSTSAAYHSGSHESARQRARWNEYHRNRPRETYNESNPFPVRIVGIFVADSELPYTLELAKPSIDIAIEKV